MLNLTSTCLCRNLAPWQTRFQSETAGYKKTTVTILNDEHPDIVMFDAFSTMGFRLNNGMRIIGPCAAFPKSLLHWNVRFLFYFSIKTHKSNTLLFLGQMMNIIHTMGYC